MAKEPSAQPRSFTKDDRRALHALLCRKTITAFWDAGVLLNKRFVERAGQGALAGLSQAL